VVQSKVAVYWDVNDIPAASSPSGAHNKSLDASGGSVFRNLLGAAKGALNRAAASTQPLCFPQVTYEICVHITSMLERGDIETLKTLLENDGIPCWIKTKTSQRQRVRFNSRVLP